MSFLLGSIIIISKNVFCGQLIGVFANTVCHVCTYQAWHVISQTFLPLKPPLMSIARRNVNRDPCRFMLLRKRRADCFRHSEFCQFSSRLRRVRTVVTRGRGLFPWPGWNVYVIVFFIHSLAFAFTPSILVNRAFENGCAFCIGYHETPFYSPTLALVHPRENVVSFLDVKSEKDKSNPTECQGKLASALYTQRVSISIIPDPS